MLVDGQKIQRLRKERHLSQKDVAAALGVSRGGVANWESGRRTPNEKQVVALAQLFDVSPEQLRDGGTRRPFTEINNEADLLRVATSLVDAGATVNVDSQGEVTITIKVDQESRLCAAFEMLEDAVYLMSSSTNEADRQSDRDFLDLWLTKTLDAMGRATDGDDDS